ncbi:glutamine synthetase [Saccharopolyspora erythraea NRRL 2338]|uniref:Glutamine synthetase (Glutamate--ammonia ligase) n=2 Tax=Saccharopolyspora erythraea TaxID=1836 RepID=A4FE98_SACEN|nr:glutamine synthetase family protein [Saccharopolyspora erythraea]EQD85190.1 glutamine synthetase [Saccharopolyspora erythraea D]PFG96100.1 glutamine synthetase [Saccharopolyspora erythraea NRRL 2338]QRK92640.1 glutamine synthetase [Saccharopolyspora erythraea]CAM02373.1 glutamine synthetase (glutamate--ammonia ligase) [Saccharopolyspora erythraea NRRL 2338]
MTSDRIPAEERADLDATAERLRAGGVSMVETSFVDNAGVVRVKSVPLDRLGFAARYGIGVSPCFETFCFDDVMVLGRHLGGPDGDLRLIPDLDRLVPLAAQPGWAWAPADKFVQEGPRFAACQRAFAASQAEALQARGLRVLAAFEHEWALGAGGVEDFVPAVTGSAYGQPRLEVVADYARDLVDALHAQNLVVHQFHPEYTTGQLELSVAATDPVAAADDAVLVRHTVRQVSLRHGWRASFAPCVVPGVPGSGAHLHLSLRDEQGSLFHGGDGPHGLRREGEAFLAGVLAELPALQAVGAGNPASYLRLQPSRWAGVWQVWGREAREAAIRLVLGVTGTGDWAANAEVKCFDATANPYLVVGAVLAAGAQGMRAGLRLPAEVSGDPVLLPEEQQPARLPTSPLAAADALEGSRVLAEAMGEALHDAVVTVRRGEGERFAEAEPAELVSLTRWRW